MGEVTAQPRSIGVLEATPPRFTPEEVAAIAADLFGLAGEARDLGSERDQTFLVDDGAEGGVMKISNLGEDPAVLDFEAAALQHVARVDPALPVAPQLRARAGLEHPLRPRHAGPHGRHYIRLFRRMRGRSLRSAELDAWALDEFGATLARLGVALRAFFHPAAGRSLLWDLAYALELRQLAPDIEDGAHRALVGRVLDRYEERVAPAWPRLRAQVIHGDLATDNALFDDRGGVAAVLDFGDLTHSALVADLAVSLGSLLRGRAGDDAFRAARLAIDGYERVTPLEVPERAVLADLVAARLATVVTISAWRVRRYPENAEYIQAWDADSWALLELLDDAGPAEAARLLTGAAARVPTARLAERRRRALGPAITALTYARPVHVDSGRGAWLVEADGGRLLDAYNNVPVVGHCHPRVTEAVVRATRRVNTHARYLYEPLVEVAERLAATMPAASGLDTVMLVNSGSEANDLAWRIALAATGMGGGLVTAHAYHGVTTAIADLSPEEWRDGYRPGHVETFAVGRGLAGALARLAERGHRPAALLVDGGFTSDGMPALAPGWVAAVAAEARDAGALVVADEVQAGHGRLGRHLWSFETNGIVPDVVTMGKPMGNGYPVAAVVTRADLADRLAATTDFFSTFGGNPVAASAALAVLDVIEDERLIAHAGEVGAALVAALDALAARHPALRAPRGRGLLVGADVVGAAAGEPDPGRARAIVDATRERGVLIGLTGPRGHVLKIRPPLAFGLEHVPVLADALDAALAETGG
jgi:4-aminobutyrate aminotransferase-like enzyme/Ser/Thr protein kinase RdoA (MazF antagonist)